MHFEAFVTHARACVKMLGTNSFLRTGTLLLYFFFSGRGNGFFLSNFVFEIHFSIRTLKSFLNSFSSVLILPPAAKIQYFLNFGYF